MKDPAGLRGELADRVDVLPEEWHCVTNWDPRGVFRFRATSEV